MDRDLCRQQVLTDEQPVAEWDGMQLDTYESFDTFSCLEDDIQAVEDDEWFTKAVQHDEAQAQCRLTEYYQPETCVDVDDEKGADWFAKANGEQECEQECVQYHLHDSATAKQEEEEMEAVTHTRPSSMAHVIPETFDVCSSETFPELLTYTTVMTEEPSRSLQNESNVAPSTPANCAPFPIKSSTPPPGLLITTLTGTVMKSSRAADFASRLGKILHAPNKKRTTSRSASVNGGRLVSKTDTNVRAKKKDMSGSSAATSRPVSHPCAGIELHIPLMQVAQQTFFG